MRTILFLVVALAGCDGGSPAPAGAPEVLQVFARERVDGELVPRLAYGDHPDIGDDDDRVVDAAVARDGQRLRVVLDQLLVGNDLEEVPCADGSWSRVPVGMDYDDVAACAADVSRCGGLCAGVGIQDQNGDGAFDDTRMIDGAAVLTCDGADVPLDRARSYYQPAGSQNLASAGADSLGPAVVIAAADGMPPGAHCGLAFSPDVVGKQGKPIADTSGIELEVEPFLVASSEPADQATDVETDAPVSVLLNAKLASVSVTATANGAAVAAAADISPDDDATALVTVTGGLAAGTTYVLTVSATDTFGDHVAGADLTFTTKEP
jgi:hypothetical protein